MFALYRQFITIFRNKFYCDRVCAPSAFSAFPWRDSPCRLPGGKPFRMGSGKLSLVQARIGLYPFAVMKATSHGDRCTCETAICMHFGPQIC